MKRLLVIFAISMSLTSCGSESSDANNSDTSMTSTEDSSKKAADSIMQTGDTSALNSAMGDSTSASGAHGQGSGSKVGGGNTGGPQSKKGK